MWGAALLFLTIFLLNLIPAFAPPTWMVFSFIGFRYPAFSVTLLAIIGALAATSGRLLLAKCSRLIIRQRLLSEDAKLNIDAIRTHLQGKKRLTFGIFLFYAFSPLPSNYLFIAYGLTNMELKLIAIPFFLGRGLSYAFWAHSSAVASQWLGGESSGVISYLSVYFVGSQILILYLIYLFTKIDWRMLLVDHRLRIVRRKTLRPGAA